MLERLIDDTAACSNLASFPSPGDEGAILLERARSEGLLDLPPPGGGQTERRFAGLAAMGELDVVLARLGEGHVDAVAILAELGGPDIPDGSRWGVWAAEPRGARLEAERQGDGFRLVGVKAYCSGAAACTHALVTATAADGRRLFVVDLGRPGIEPVDGTWPAIGMARSDSRSVRFDTCVHADDALGTPGAYLERPGFWHGGVGVAACWYGGAVGVARRLLEAAHERGDRDPHLLAHLGAVDASLLSMRAALMLAAAEIDGDPRDRRSGGRRRARRTRAIVESGATAVLDRVGRALGAGPLCLETHGQRVADLQVYLRQSHAEHDLAALGADIRDRCDWVWPTR